MKSHKELITLLIISAIILLLNVGSYGVVESSDARYAEIAREMFVSGDYLHPNLLNVHHYHKPPFTYQITALGYKLLGINPFGARFFLQIAVLIQIMLMYALSLTLFNNKKTAFWSALVYFSFPIVLISSRNLTTDAFLTTFALLSMYSWVKYRKTGYRIYMYIFTFSLAMGFLTKGPVIFIVPLPFVIAYNRIEKAKNGFSIHHIAAWLLFIVAGASWYLLLVKENPGFIDYFLGRQTIDRFSKNAFDRTEPFWYFIVLAPAVGLPWLLFLPYLIKINKKLFTKKSLYMVLSLSVIVPLLFFSISSSKRILYILPFYSLIAILIAELMYKIQLRQARKVFWFVIFYSTLIFSLFAFIGFIDPDLEIPLSAIMTGMVMIIVIILIFNLKKISYTNRAIFATFLVSAFLLVSGSEIMSKNELKINSPKPITDFISNEGLDDRQVLIYNTRKPAIAFGLNKSVISIYDGSGDLDREIQFEKDSLWKNYLINLTNDTEVLYLKELLQKPTVLLVYKNSVPENREWITKGYENIKIMGKWTIYY